jgi:hypothetical protein
MQRHLVLTTLLVLQEDRHLQNGEVEQLIVILPGDGTQVEDLLIFCQGKYRLVNIGKLIAGCVYPDAVGIAF